jgi:hypothetical protein
MTYPAHEQAIPTNGAGTHEDGPRVFTSFAEFYPFYLGEHSDPTCRRLHVIGTSLALGCIATAAVTGNPAFLLAAPVVGYGFAWVGHFGFEGNRPAAFKNPIYSLMGDMVMLRDVVTGRIPW